MSTVVRVLWTAAAERWDEATLHAARDRVPEALLRAMPRYRRWQDVQMGLCGKLLLRRALRVAGCGGAALARMTWSESRRPALPIEGDFNLSHSGGLVACAYAPDARLGLDVEQVHRVSVEDIAHALSGREQQALDAAADPMVEFFRMWTFKEAVIKADGRGVGIDLRLVDSLANLARVDGREWHVTRLGLPAGYDGHLACDRAGVAVDLREVRLHELLD